MEIENFTFSNSRGQELAARIYYNDRSMRRGVLFSHGLFSSKDGYKITKMAEYIVNAGYTLMTFDFTYSGESPGDICDISVMQEVDDLCCAADVFRGMGIEALHLMGSSMGGAVSILAGSGENLSPESIILIATPVNFNGLIPADISDYENEDGMVYISGVQVNK
jgi:dienelactone hydrolase